MFMLLSGQLPGHFSAKDGPQDPITREGKLHHEMRIICGRVLTRHLPKQEAVIDCQLLVMTVSRLDNLLHHIYARRPRRNSV